MNKLTLKEYLLYDALKDEPLTEQDFQAMLRKLESENGRPVKPHRSGGGHWVGKTTNDE